jgi:3-oxoacyl-[acyl-carrier protein] reductase
VTEVSGDQVQRRQSQGGSFDGSSEVSALAIVTGGSPVATAVSSFLTSRGLRVVVMGPSDGADPATKAIECHFESETEVAAALEQAEEQLGGVDLSVHTWMAPGLTEPQSFETIDEATWISAVEGSLAGAWWLCRHLVRPLRASARSSLIFVVPTVGLTGAADFSMLATVSEGLRVLAKGVGRQTGEDGVTVHTIAANPEHWIPSASDGSLHRAISLSPPALGGRGDLAGDLAPLIAMLASPDAHFWTAGTLVADGGIWMAL